MKSLLFGGAAPTLNPPSRWTLRRVVFVEKLPVPSCSGGRAGVSWTVSSFWSNREKQQPHGGRARMLLPIFTEAAPA